MRPSDANSITSETLGARLARDRLTWRARRIEAVIAVLRQQAVGPLATTYAHDRHIHRAITGFEAEAAAIDAALTDLAVGAARSSGGSNSRRDRRA